MSVNGAKQKNKIMAAVVGLVFLLTAVSAVVLSLSFGGSTAHCDETGTYSVKLDKNMGTDGFLEQFDLSIRQEVSCTEVVIPPKDDKVFAKYIDMQKKQGLDPSSFSGKKGVEYIFELKEKSLSGETLFASVLVCGDRVAAAHLTTFEYGTELYLLWEGRE